MLPTVRVFLEVGEMLIATHYLQAQRYRTLLRHEFMQAVNQADAFLCPTSSGSDMYQQATDWHTREPAL